MGGDLAGVSGTTTSSPTATTATDTGASFGTLTGHMVVIGGVYGVIVSNTSTVLTVDRWYTPASPGGAAASTPASGAYVVLPGQAPYWYMALSTNGTAPSATDTTLTSEITTAGGGLIRKLATYAHTTGASSYSLAATFTVNGSDTGLPVTIQKIGIFNSLTSGRMQFETLLSATATLSAVGDSVTVTDTVSL
jgi:hypothetical protein